MMISKRIHRLQKALQANNLEIFYVGDCLSLFYLTGLTLSKGALFITRDRATLFIDKRYEEYVENSPLEKRSYSEISSFLKDFQTLAFEGEIVSYEESRKFKEALFGKKEICSLPLVQNLRRIKDDEEIEALKRSARHLLLGFDYIKSILEPNITEKKVAVAFEKYCLDLGAEKMAFDPIIAFGVNSSMPHYRSGDTRLQRSSIVLVDIGIVLDHYASDMTRTFFIGNEDAELKQIYEIVDKAKEKALSLCKVGAKVSDLDASVREVFRKENVEKYYAHSLGHGIGLEVHEPPILRSSGPYAEERLQKNMVLTIEPGLYIPKKGGVRIEEMIQITEENHTIYTT